MKVVILAGGLGTRISEYTKVIPKPMVNISGKPIILHIMKHFAKYGHREFFIAVGYKGDVIKKFFRKNKFGWNVNIIETGKKTMTGGRIKRLKTILKNERFFLTYGDGISNVNLNALLSFHKSKKSSVTLTAVRPTSRFGVIKIKNSKVSYFKEKSRLDESWINGGFFVFKKEIFKFLGKGNEMLERSPMIKLSKKKQLVGYKHKGFWQCMDTPRDKEFLKKLLRENNAPWKN